MKEVWNGEIPPMRLLSAAELLSIRQQVAKMECADAQEASLWCNALVLAACCREFSDAQDVLERLTARQMEQFLLAFLHQEDAKAVHPAVGESNPSFDEERYLRLKEGAEA